MNIQTSRKTNEMPDCTKRRLRAQKAFPVWNETKTYKMTFPLFFSQVVRESHFGCPRIEGVISSEELGTMSKNNLSRITLVRRPIWGIHSLTLIISCPTIHPALLLKWKFHPIWLEIHLSSYLPDGLSNVSSSNTFVLNCFVGTTGNWIGQAYWNCLSIKTVLLNGLWRGFPLTTEKL